MNRLTRKLKSYYYKIMEAPRITLFLDYDGTLVPIAKTPQQAKPQRETIQAVTALSRLSKIDLWIVSGRNVNDLRKVFHIKDINLIGGHGATMLHGAKKKNFVNVANLQKLIEKTYHKAKEAIGSKRGFLIENKGISIALHYRLARPGRLSQTIHQFVKVVKETDKHHILQRKRGKKILEFHHRNINKGKAVKYVLSQDAKKTLPIYLGDDITDEDAFYYLKDKGVTILVSKRPHRTYAKLRLDGPREVTDFLHFLYFNYNDKQENPEITKNSSD